MAIHDPEGKIPDSTIWIAIGLVVLIFILGTCNLAHAVGAPVAKPDGPGEAKCVAIWGDFFPVPELENQYGKGVFVEIKVEHCPGYNSRVLKVWKRFYREYDDGKKLIEADIKTWSVINGWQKIGLDDIEKTPPPEQTNDCKGEVCYP